MSCDLQFPAPVGPPFDTDQLQSGFCTALHVPNSSICVFFFLFCWELHSSAQGEKVTGGLQQLDLNDCPLRDPHWVPPGKPLQAAGVPLCKGEKSVGEEEGGALLLQGTLLLLFTTWEERIEDWDTRKSQSFLPRNNCCKPGPTGRIVVQLEAGPAGLLTPQTLVCRQLGTSNRLVG